MMRRRTVIYDGRFDKAAQLFNSKMVDVTALTVVLSRTVRSHCRCIRALPRGKWEECSRVVPQTGPRGWGEGGALEN